jgi:membrane glycosyltransferase
MHGRIPPMTPAGLQRLAELKRRRLLVAGMSSVIYLTMLLWLAVILGAGGWTFLRVAILIAFAIAAPWSVLGVSNAALGFWLLHFHRDGLAAAAPFGLPAASGARLRSRTALLLTIRNEDPSRAFQRLRAMRESLEATGFGDRFAFFVLSDTSDSWIAYREEAELNRWLDEDPALIDRLHYRRRVNNEGYKAGNIRDFVERWGGAFDFMIPLDADSLMDGATIIELLRIGEAHEGIGILQTLVVGAPSDSAFARVFQFGMRHGMRAYTMGAAWWAGDCGPFWGHNALVRIAPFAQHCVLPKLEGDRHILSHDQIEAALMRRAGFEVRVLPIECGSYEENPPTLIDFVRRELRWCQGNMQYVKLLGLPDLAPVSRFQLIWAISMFIGAPASIAIIALAALLPAVEDVSSLPATSLKALYLTFLGMHFAPKLAGLADVALTPGGLASYGGRTRFWLGAVIEIASSFVIGAVTSLSETMFLTGLLFGRTIGWPGQVRDAHELGLRETASALWPHLAFGATILGLAGTVAPSLALWSAPLTLGFVVAIPFALATAAPAAGALLRRAALCATPEEITETKILRRLRRQATLAGRFARIRHNA